MVILNSKRPTESSSTEGSDRPSDDEKKRFYKQPRGPRQTPSSSSPESNTDESSGDGDPLASSVPQPKRAPQAKVRDPGPSVKARKDSKRNREEVGGQEQVPAKKNNAPKKTDAGKKPSPPRQRETLSKGTGEKTPAKSVKEKRSTDLRDCTKTIEAAEARTAVGLNEIRADCMKMIETAKARTAAFVEKQFKSVRESLQRGDGGIRSSRASSIMNRELMDGIHAACEFPLLDGAKAERLEQKWRELRIVEMELFSRRLDLLQEECKMCLEGLKSPTGSGRS